MSGIKTFVGTWSILILPMSYVMWRHLAVEVAINCGTCSRSVTSVGPPQWGNISI